jgi:hypothetical protein
MAETYGVQRDAAVANEHQILGRWVLPWVGAVEAIFVYCATLGSPLYAANEEPQSDSSDGLPEAYAKNYLVAASTLSPDKKLAVIYPKLDPEEFTEGKDYIVSLQPFAILGSLNTKWPYF